MIQIAVFASGSGSNFQALVDAVESGELNARIALLVCDRPNARVIERAREHGVPAFIFSAKDYDGKAHFEREIVAELEQREVDFIALAGYMRLIGDTLLSAFEGRIVNIHPSLLPAFPGVDAVGQALEAGVKVSGVTIHFVDAGMDTGQIIAQQAVPVFEDDNHEQLQNRIQKVEHELYPKTVEELIQRREIHLCQSNER
ncbi:MAG TPA: phosphoribosylglycinamide formyltransferase [Bacillales bacterium]|nr:phosphoribosylglycinamide formyltransferase [Bacillales bacterium]